MLFPKTSHFMKKTKFLIMSVCILMMFSCTTQRKLTYFNNIDKVNIDSLNAHYNPATDQKLIIGDQLVITVNASDPAAAAPFNQPMMSYMQSEAETTTMRISTTPNLQYYTIDKEGNILFPVLGVLHLADLTKSAAIDTITNRLKAYLQDPIVDIKPINFSVTVLGEVNKPGRYSVSNGRLSVLEALGMAGDMTAYGKRNSVTISRETDGKMSFATLDLNDANVFASPFFFLQQNDVIYVQPNKVRAVASQNLSLYLSMSTTLASIATVVVSIVNITKK